MNSNIERLEKRFAGHDALILDGGLATELQRRGHVIDDPLWSARLLCDDPAVIQQMHYDYLTAGANCLITATYQATFAGLENAGFSHSQAADILRRGVDLAIAAKTQWQNKGFNNAERGDPLIAASVGPYGAFLHDGSEYRGDYGLSRSQLAAFHRERLQLLAATEAELLACETIPSLLEAEALREVLHESPGTAAWFSFSCRNGTQICHGEPISECAKLLDESPQVVAMGVNCTAPQFIESLIKELRRATEKPIVAYPNSGETWDARQRCWTGTSNPQQFAELARTWQAAGATLIGGCCRTGPEHIRALRAALGK